jgi:N-acyl amino acid synthase of PEP-CTERM/exosortase system
MLGRLQCTDSSCGTASPVPWALLYRREENTIEHLRDIYESYFDINYDVSADNKLLEQVLALRYQVYCVENDYEEADRHPDGFECDEYDDRSIHSLLIHRASGGVAGTVRMILPDPNSPQGSLPIDQVCEHPALRDQQILPRDTIAEVSRFAVSKQFRRRLEDAPTPSGVGPGWVEHRSAQRRVPHISLGLAQALVCNGFRFGITHLVAVMEPALLRMYEHLGVHWTKLGPKVQFHGRRQPCWTRLDEMMRGTRLQRPDIWELVTANGRCINERSGQCPTSGFATRARPPCE